MSLCASRLLPGAGGRSPARRGAWGERGKSPLHPRTPLVREREICLLSRAVPRPPRVARGIGANLPRPEAGAMSAPAAALRPPSGRPGSPLRPRHAASAARGGRNKLAGRQRRRETGGQESCFSSRSRRAAVTRSTNEVAPVSRRVKRTFLDVEGRPLCFTVFGRFSLLLRVSPFSKGVPLPQRYESPEHFQSVVSRKNAVSPFALGRAALCPAPCFAFFNDKTL